MWSTVALLLLGLTSPGSAAEEVERAPESLGFVSVENPAFPPAEPRASAPLPVKPLRLEDFSPYFKEPRLAQAKLDFDAGRYGRAWETLKAEGEGAALPVRYLRALSALRSAHLAEGAREMVRLSASLPALRDRCLAHAALAREELGELKSAASLYLEVDAGSRLYLDARFGLARTLRKLGDLEGAAGALDPLLGLAAPMWGRDVGAEALAAVADLRRAQGKGELERAALEKLWSAHPLSPLSNLKRLRPGGRPPSPESQVLRAETLLDSHRNKAAIAALGPLVERLELPDPLACRAQFAMGKGLRKEREHTRAIKVLKGVVERCQEPELRIRALYVLGSSGSIVEPEVGLTAYDQLISEAPEHPFADDALVYAAELELKLGRADAALERLGQVAARYPDGDFAAEALFKAFWLRKERGEAESALKTLDEIERRYAHAEESYDFDRARYWRGRMMQEHRDFRGAADQFMAVADGSPSTYYGLISRQRLSELDPKRLAELQVDLASQGSEKADPWPIEVSAIERDPHFAAGVELLRMGLMEGAAAEFLAVKRGELPIPDRRLLVQLMSLADDARSAHSVARTSLRGDLSGRIGSKNRAIWEVAYPNAFRSLIERYCAEARIDPDLLQALMREESALDPKALSWAGAIGLTQLMPSTANSVARTLKLKRVSTQALLQPELNIRLGATYLGSLVRKFEGSLPHAIAAYNAGAAAVSRWKANLPDRLTDAWVEEIPIAETRGYVKRVLRTFNTYQLLYGRGIPLRVAQSGKSASALQ